MPASTAGAGALRLGAPVLPGGSALVGGCACEGALGGSSTVGGGGGGSAAGGWTAGACVGADPGSSGLGGGRLAMGGGSPGGSRHDRSLATGVVVQQPQAHDRRYDEGKREGQPAHGALPELLLLGRGRWLCHRSPRSLFLAIANSIILSLQPPKPFLGPLPAPRPRAQTTDMGALKPARRRSPPFYLRAVMLS